MFSHILPARLKTSIRKKLLSAKVPVQLSSNFRAQSDDLREALKASLRENYFSQYFAGDEVDEYLGSEAGEIDLQNHLILRLQQDRQRVIPWLSSVEPLTGRAILEIGCGTGSSTVALAEQGARVTAVDISESSLHVARERCRLYGLDVEFVNANGVEVADLFRSQKFDFIIFWASLEHMTQEERLKAMKDTWDMLEVGQFWCVIETPNRLAYYDWHTSLLPFYLWLPDELAYSYARFSPRQVFCETFPNGKKEKFSEFLRWGRGVSFHEFDLALKPTQDLDIVSSLPVFLREQRLLGRLALRFSLEYKYESILRTVAPKLHPGFFQASLDLIIRKN